MTKDGTLLNMEISKIPTVSIARADDILAILLLPQYRHVNHAMKANFQHKSVNRTQTNVLIALLDLNNHHYKAWLIVYHVVLANLKLTTAMNSVYNVIPDNIDLETIKIEKYVSTVQLDLHKPYKDKDPASNATSANMQTEQNN